MSYQNNRGAFYAATIAALQSATDTAKAQAKGRQWGAPSGLADQAERFERNGDLPMAAAYYRLAAANSAGNSRADMYEGAADRLECKVDANVRVAVIACQRQ